MFCLLWMPQQMNLLLHMYIVRTLCLLLWMPQQKDLLLHTDTIVMYMYQTCYEAGVKTINELYYICVSDTRRLT